MAAPGLALVGFMPEPFAVQYLTHACVWEDGSPTALAQHWASAQTRLGPPISGAGFPEILDLPPEYDAHLQGVPTNPRFGMTVGLLPWSFKLVEIERLLAFQFHVYTERSASLCGLPAGPIPLDKALELCLPHRVEDVPYTFNEIPGGFVIRSKNLNLGIRGPFRASDPNQQVELAGMAFGVNSPLVQVVRHQGRCYLRNGYHRTYGLWKAGNRHVPCVLIEASDFGQTGAGQPLTFDRELLESGNPPTCAHFVRELAYPVSFQDVRRVIEWTCREYVLPADN